MARPKQINNSKPELTEAEWTIMKVVWDNEPCAAGTVQEALEKSKGDLAEAILSLKQ